MAEENTQPETESQQGPVKAPVETEKTEARLPQALREKLLDDPELMIMLTKALTAKGCLVTISWYEVNERDPSKDLRHWWQPTNFVKEHVRDSLRYILSCWVAENCPGADPEKLQQFV